MPEMPNTGLLAEEIDSIISAIVSKCRIEKLVLFGSRAKGNFSNGSDIDIAIFGKNLTLNDIVEASTALDDLDLPYKFDIIIYDRISSATLREHINRVGLLLFENQSVSLLSPITH